MDGLRSAKAHYHVAISRTGLTDLPGRQVKSGHWAAAEASVIERRSRGVLDTRMRGVTVVSGGEQRILPSLRGSASDEAIQTRHSGAMRSIEPGISRFADAQLRI